MLLEGFSFINGMIRWIVNIKDSQSTFCMADIESEPREVELLAQTAARAFSIPV